MLKGALDAMPATVYALSGTSPAKHFVLPSTRRQTSTIYSGLSLQTMTQEILSAHRTSQAVFDSKQWSCLQLPTYLLTSVPLPRVPRSQLHKLSHGSSSHAKTHSNNLMG